MTMEAAITDAIQKHLPGAMGAELQKLLADGAEAIRKGKYLEAENAQLKMSIERWVANGKRNDELNTRETKLAAAETDLAMRIAVAKAIEDQREGRLKDLKEVVSLVFQNAKLKEHVYRSRQENTPQSGGFTSQTTLNDSEQREREQ
jgi:hypothetical protein